MHKVCTQTTLRHDRWGWAAESNRKRTSSIGGKRALRRLERQGGEEGNGADRRTNKHSHRSETDMEHRK